MPERPDLEYAVPILAKTLVGRRIEHVSVPKPVVLRVLCREPFAELVEGSRIEAVERRAHFVLFRLDGPKGSFDMPVAPMLAGRFLVTKASERRPKDLALVLELDDRNELRYRDDVQMGKVFLTPRDRWDQIPGLAQIGVDVLDAKRFTLAAFKKLVKTRRDQVKVFLMDKAALDSMGNAYADEVLFAAGIHPKAMARSLEETAVARLHGAIVSVLTEARDEIARRRPKTDEKIRDFLKVRGRPGEPCTACGTKLRRAGVRGHDAIFCPSCQPDGRGTGIVDWSKLAKRGDGGAPEPVSKANRAKAASAAKPAAKPRAKPRAKTTAKRRASS